MCSPSLKPMSTRKLAGAAGALAGQREFVAALGGWTVAATLAAWLGRGLALRRNAALKPRSTLAKRHRHPQPGVIVLFVQIGAFSARTLSGRGLQPC